jgi:hypothetical protein
VIKVGSLVMVRQDIVKIQNIRFPIGKMFVVDKMAAIGFDPTLGRFCAYPKNSSGFFETEIRLVTKNTVRFYGRKI